MPGRGRLALPRGRRSSSGLRSGTTASAATPPSTTSRPAPSRRTCCCCLASPPSGNLSVETGYPHYVGRAKTLFQLLLAATVANLTLAATGAGLMRGHRRRQHPADTYTRSPLAAIIALCRYLAGGRLPAIPASHLLLAG